MGRLIVFILVVITLVMLWKAFGPGSGNTPSMGRLGQRRDPEIEQKPRAKGPDDDPDFLWNIEKERFKKRREQERLAEEEAQRAERERLRRQQREAGQNRRAGEERQAEQNRGAQAHREAKENSDRDQGENPGQDHPEA